MHPKSFVSNFWGAVHTDIASLFTFLLFYFFTLPRATLCLPTR